MNSADPRWWEEAQGKPVSVATMSRKLASAALDAYKKSLAESLRDEAAPHPALRLGTQRQVLACQVPRNRGRTTTRLSALSPLRHPGAPLPLKEAQMPSLLQPPCVRGWPRPSSRGRLVILDKPFCAPRRGYSSSGGGAQMYPALLALVLARPHAHSGEAFSKRETRLRRAAARGREVAPDAIGERWLP